MSTLADVFRSLNAMRDDGVIDQYAIGGAVAVLFYVEPARTYDVDVFVTSRDGDRTLTPLAPVCAWADRHGFTVDAEHLIVHGVPVQVLPAWSPLVVEAVESARTHDYDGVAVRVADPECLSALALQARGARRRERAWQLLESDGIDRGRLRDLCRRHGIDARIPDDV